MGRSKKESDEDDSMPGSTVLQICKTITLLIHYLNHVDWK